MGSEAVRFGLVSPYQLRTGFRAIYPNIYLSNAATLSLRTRSTRRVPLAVWTIQSTRVACTSQNGACARAPSSHGSITRKRSSNFSA